MSETHCCMCVHTLFVDQFQQSGSTVVLTLLWSNTSDRHTPVRTNNDKHTHTPLMCCIVLIRKVTVLSSCWVGMRWAHLFFLAHQKNDQQRNETHNFPLKLALEHTTKIPADDQLNAEMDTSVRRKQLVCHLMLMSVQKVYIWEKRKKGESKRSSQAGPFPAPPNVVTSGLKKQRWRWPQFRNARFQNGRSQTNGWRTVGCLLMWDSESCVFFFWSFEWQLRQSVYESLIISADKDHVVIESPRMVT